MGGPLPESRRGLVGSATCLMRTAATCCHLLQPLARGLARACGVGAGSAPTMLSALPAHGQLGVTCVGNSPEQAQELYDETKAVASPSGRKFVMSTNWDGQYSVAQAVVVDLSGLP